MSDKGGYIGIAYDDDGNVMLFHKGQFLGSYYAEYDVPDEVTELLKEILPKYKEEDNGG